MKYCGKCGKEIVDEAVVCPECGCVVKHCKDKGGFGWGALGCCVPVAGLVLYLVWRESSPLNAKAVGIGAIVNVVLCVILWILYFVLIFMGVLMTATF